MTVGRTIPMYAYNSTSGNERWHFYYDDAFSMLNYTEQTNFCAQYSGQLPIVQELEENDRMAAYFQVLQNPLIENRHCRSN